MTETAAAPAVPVRPGAGPAPQDVGRRTGPGLRLVPAPPHDPPYDDEVGPRPRLRLVPPPTTTPDIPAAPRVPGGAELPDARPFAQALVQRLLEVCGGLRPVPQLRHDTAPQLYAELERALGAPPRTAGTRPCPAGPGPDSAAVSPRPAARDVRSVHVQQRETTAEVCATVRRGGRYRALALRLEAVQGRWTCTSITGL